MTTINPYRETPDGISVNLWVTPNASKNEIQGIIVRDNNQAVVRIRVNAVPDKGKANKAVIALLAKHLSVPKNTLEIISGQISRQKTVHITGDFKSLSQAIQNLPTGQKATNKES